MERRALSGWKAGAARIARVADRRLGPLGRAVAIPLQELRTHVQRLDQNAHGASAQEGEVARSRPGDDRGQEPGEDRETVRRPSDHRVPLAASVPARARRRQASQFERMSRRMRPSSSNPSRAAGPTCRARRVSEANGPASGPLSGQHSRPRRPRPERRDLRRCTAAGRQRLDRRGADGRRYARKSSRRRWRQAVGRLRQPSQHPFHAVPSPGKPAPETPHLHINNVNAYHGRLKQWLNRFNGVATKNLPSYLGWRRPSKAGQRLDPPN